MFVMNYNNFYVMVVCDSNSLYFIVWKVENCLLVYKRELTMHLMKEVCTCTVLTATQLCMYSTYHSVSHVCTVLTTCTANVFNILSFHH